MSMNPISTGADWDFELLERYDTAIAEIAAEYRLDTYPNQIEIITSEQMIDAYATSGLPVGYPHWSYGKEFIRNVGWYDNHGPRAIMQTLPDGHFVETGVHWDTGFGLHQHGIETPEQRVELAALGVHLGQGYLFGRPEAPKHDARTSTVPALVGAYVRGMPTGDAEPEPEPVPVGRRRAQLRPLVEPT